LANAGLNFRAFAAEMTNDASRNLHHAASIDEKAILRAALITLRRAICERFPLRAEQI
jgi:hypothetical protein